MTLSASLAALDDAVDAAAALELDTSRARRILADARQRLGFEGSAYVLAFVGGTGVGKSSLLNALLGRERAIVSDVPGTTRDTLEEWADLDGLKALFIDTAGLRDKSLDPIEALEIGRAHV